MAAIVVDNVTKSFERGRAAVQQLSLEVGDGELLVLVGPSGCGKSTLLRLIAGLESPTSGVIRLGGRDVTAVSPADRDLAMVFQNYALYPHKNVRENMAFGLRMRRVSAAQIAARVAAAASALGLNDLLERTPGELSGGQRQRVALGRAIVREPQAFLLDEPLSNLDPLLRVATRAELSLLHRRLRTTMIYVTHDQEEAMTLGARVAVMRDGQIEQVAPPRVLFDRPATLFVARFIGAPTINLWPAHRHATGRLVLDGMAETMLDTVAPAGTGRGLLAGVRPHDLEIDRDGRPGQPARIEIVEPLGATTVIHASCEQAAALIRISVGAHVPFAVGDRIVVRVRSRQALLFDSTTGRRLPTAGGELM